MTFEDDKDAYGQKDAAGLIKLNALRLRTLGMRGRKGKGRSRPQRFRAFIEDAEITAVFVDSAPAC